MFGDEWHLVHCLAWLIIMRPTETHRDLGLCDAEDGGDPAQFPILCHHRQHSDGKAHWSVVADVLRERRRELTFNEPKTDAKMARRSFRQSAEANVRFSPALAPHR